LHSFKEEGSTSEHTKVEKHAADLLSERALRLGRYRAGAGLKATFSFGTYHVRYADVDDGEDAKSTSHDPSPLLLASC
jgi:hypothetical protein